MPVLRFGELSLEREGRETVLDTLLRHGVAIPNSCRAGVCGSCLMRAVEGAVPEAAQAGLKDSWRERGYFLACSCAPENDLSVATAQDEARVRAVIHSVEALNADVARVRLAPASKLDYRAGQYVAIIRPDGLARSYSLASLPHESELELHVRRIPGGRMSGWLFEEARAGDEVDLLGPSGECFYTPGRPEQPIVLAGTSTGLAPLYGVLRDALARRHTGPIHLFHGALRQEGLYLREELSRLADEHANLDYRTCVLESADGARDPEAALDRAILQRIPKFAGWRAFLCGDPGLVQQLKKRLFLAGIALRDLHADPFVTAPAAVLA